jgi:hypothetical protein
MLTAVLAFIGWLVLKVLDLERKLVELEGRITARERDCEHHHLWMDGLNTKMDNVANDVAFIRGRLVK